MAKSVWIKKATGSVPKPKADDQTAKEVYLDLTMFGPQKPKVTKPARLFEK